VRSVEDMFLLSSSVWLYSLILSLADYSHCRSRGYCNGLCLGTVTSTTVTIIVMSSLALLITAINPHLPTLFYSAPCQASLRS